MICNCIFLNTNWWFLTSLLYCVFGIILIEIWLWKILEIVEKADVYYQNTQRYSQNEEKENVRKWMGRRKLWKMIKWKNKIWIYYKASFSHLYNFNNSPSFSFHSLLIICIQGYSLDILYEEWANRENPYIWMYMKLKTRPHSTLYLFILFLFLMLSLTAIQIQPPNNISVGGVRGAARFI